MRAKAAVYSIALLKLVKHNRGVARFYLVLFGSDRVAVAGITHPDWQVAACLDSFDELREDKCDVSSPEARDEGDAAGIGGFIRAENI